MDDATLTAAEGDLVAWGLLEGDQPTWTRRFRGAVMRAAGELAARERAGERPDGAPLVNTVTLALASWPLPAGATATETHVRFLVAVELAALPGPVADLLSGERPTAPETSPRSS